MSFQVFISYRRADQPALAAWLHHLLAGELQSDEVFLDLDALESGDHFPEALQRAIESALVFIALIGPRWNPLTSANGEERRLDSSKDFVRREVAAGLECLRSDPRRLFLPVLFDGATMPPQGQLPECLRALTDHVAAVLPQPYEEGLRRIVQTVTRRLEDLDTTAPEEKWILRQIVNELSGMDRHLIRQIGCELGRRFPSIANPPESARALARSIYRIGPSALESFLAVGCIDERMIPLLDLLATHWIKSDTARTLRRTLGNCDSRIGRKVALECDYADFTPYECLLKASRLVSGWPTVPVDHADEPEEIIAQIHDDLLRRFGQKLMAKKTRPSETKISGEARRRQERIALCALLERRRADEGRALPVILVMDHRMTLDRSLVRKVQLAFPPLHILVATGDPDELKVTGRFAAILTPSDTEQVEKDAYDAYADAREMITEKKRGDL